MVLFFNFGISKFGKIFQKLVKFTLKIKKFALFFQFFCQFVNHNEYLEKRFSKRKNDQTKKIEPNEKAII
jgi:energy-converting hydrogenase Eha subunit H